MSLLTDVNMDTNVSAYYTRLRVSGHGLNVGAENGA